MHKVNLQLSKKEHHKILLYTPEKDKSFSHERKILSA